MSQQDGYICVNCGLPLTNNRHPDAGKLQQLVAVGVQWGCLPCANAKAAGLRQMIYELRDWLERELAAEESQGNLGMSLAYQAALRRLHELNAARQQELYAADKYPPVVFDSSISGTVSTEQGRARGGATFVSVKDGRFEDPDVWVMLQPSVNRDAAVQQSSVCGRGEAVLFCDVNHNQGVGMNVWESVGQMPDDAGLLPGSSVFKARIGIFTLTVRQPVHARRLGLGWEVRCDPPIFSAREFPFKEEDDAKESAALLMSRALLAADRAVTRLLADSAEKHNAAPAVIESVRACCLPSDVSSCGAVHRYRMRLHWSDDRTTVTHPRDMFQDVYVDAQMIIDRSHVNPVRVVTSTLEEYIEPLGWTEAVGFEDTLNYRIEDGSDPH